MVLTPNVSSPTDVTRENSSSSTNSQSADAAMTAAPLDTDTSSVGTTPDAAAVYRGQPEDILVVPRTVLADHGLLGQGFMQSAAGKNVTMIEQLIRVHGQFAPRDRMEVDETYKQIIPYFVFTHNDQLFLMQRSGGANESRLASKYTLGIGGHVRHQDLIEGNIAQWGHREFTEEVAYEGGVSITPLGILNDDSDAVGRVHLGVVYLLHGDSSKIAIRSELQSGRLASRDECQGLYESMEGWSQMVFDALKNARYI